MPPVVVWFRDDLRLSDQAALRNAVGSGQPIIPLYVLDDETPGAWRKGGAARWWLASALERLDDALRALGGRLILRRGRARDEVVRLMGETGAGEVFVGAGHEPWTRADDSAIASRLGVGRFRWSRTRSLFEPGQIKTKTGGPFQVFGAFARACLAEPAWHAPSPAPNRISFADAPDSDRLVDWGLRPTRPDWADGLRGAWTGTAAEALERFAAQGLAEYDTGRDAVGHDGTSRLSPYLASGEISARQVWEASLAVPGEGTEALRRELLWREFSIHQLSHNPALPESPARPAFAAMPWRSDPAALEAWRRGRTGVPIVDAGMRQLWRTGWMHNRARMIVASFLTKHLLIDWRAGQSWFWDTLVDADLANNAANWQWVAGCGADAAPYFRVFNPVLQGRKFDPDGAYVRTWVPELADMPARWIHAPWEAPATTAGYGPPIVDLGAGRARALAAFAGLRG